MERASWIVDGPWIARNIKNASISSALQIQDCKAYINCPQCSYPIGNSNVLTPWPGLPKGVKFEPTDEEVIEHLEAQCGISGLKPDSIIQYFICSLVTNINYTHPENLPGVSKDGTSVFFFTKTEKAYLKGKQKRRKITKSGLTNESVRWLKTGKTKPVVLNGVQRGCKNILVLYKSTRKGFKSEKYNWVMHQYHLGTEKEEIGEFVVSKIVYKQPKQTADESESFGIRSGPSTPKNTTPSPSRYVISVSENATASNDTMVVLDPSVQGLENIPEASYGSTTDKRAQEEGDLDGPEDNLMHKKNEGSSSLVEKNPNSWDFNIASEKADLGTLPDFLSFASEDSLLNWLGWI